jgi:hypothetical protein
MADMKPATAMRPPDDPMVPLRPNNVDAVDAVNEWVEAPDAVQVEEEAGGQLDDDSDEDDGTEIEWFPLEELDDGGTPAELRRGGGWRRIDRWGNPL